MIDWAGSSTSTNLWHDGLRIEFSDLTGSRRVQRRLPPEEVEELVAGYLAGAMALALAGRHSIHRTTVLALLERHRVSRRGRVLAADHIERAVASYASGHSCASIGKKLRVNPETSARSCGRPA